MLAKFAYDGTEYELVDPDTWTTLDAIKLEMHTARKPVELMQDLMDGGALGVHSAVWVSLRRAGVDVAWDGLDLPWVATLESFKGDPVSEPPDPSMASTEERKAVKPRRSAPAQSRKK